jgi:hypothetical protein
MQVLFDRVRVGQQDVAIYAVVNGNGVAAAHYDLFDSEGRCLNVGEPFWRPPSAETLRRYLSGEGIQSALRGSQRPCPSPRVPGRHPRTHLLATRLHIHRATTRRAQPPPLSGRQHTKQSTQRKGRHRMMLVAAVQAVDGSTRSTVMSTKAKTFDEAFEAITTCVDAQISQGIRTAISRMRGGSFLAGRYTASIYPERIRPARGRGRRRRSPARARTPRA